MSHTDDRNYPDRCHECPARTGDRYESVCSKHGNASLDCDDAEAPCIESACPESHDLEDALDDYASRNH